MNIPSELFIKNRYKLTQRMKPGSALVLFGADEMPRNGDQYFPYRQNSDFYYLTGIRQERSALILCPGHKNPDLKEVLLIIRPTPELETWNGHKLTAEEAQTLSGIKKIIFPEEFDSTLFEILSPMDAVYLNKPEIPKFFPDVISRDERLGKQIREKYPYHEYLRIAPILRELRSIKEDYEIQAIKKAIHITKLGFLRVLKSITPAWSEKDVEAELWHEFIRNGAMGHAFPPIVASGINACSLHYTDNNRQMEDGELMLMDFGAEYSYYAADCSRTIPVNGTFSDRQADLYDGLLGIFKKTKEIMKPGTRMEEIHKKVSEWMGSYHISVGLYTENEAQKAINNSPLWFNYYMHGTGHSLGLDVHDAYDKDAVLAPGMIFTCEPGIYIKEEKTGIRLENDILITENGNIDLMEELPIERKDIERMMKKH